MSLCKVVLVEVEVLELLDLSRARNRGLYPLTAPAEILLWVHANKSIPNRLLHVSVQNGAFLCMCARFLLCFCLHFCTIFLPKWPENTELWIHAQKALYAIPPLVLTPFPGASSW